MDRKRWKSSKIVSHWDRRITFEHSQKLYYPNIHLTSRSFVKDSYIARGFLKPDWEFDSEYRKHVSKFGEIWAVYVDFELEIL